MKVTQQQLNQIITEEVQAALLEENIERSIKKTRIEFEALMKEAKKNGCEFIQRSGNSVTILNIELRKCVGLGKEFYLTPEKSRQ